MTIEIVHTRAEGTLVYGTHKGDGTAIILGARNRGGCGFRWSRNLGLWYLPHSRDKSARMSVINETQQRLERAEYRVAVKIDNDERRSFADAEAERSQLAEDRADRYAGYGSTAAARSTAAHERSNAAVDGIPAGQPILVGHYSERRHRRAIERSHAAMRRSIEEAGKAEYWADRAAGAAKRQTRRESVPTTLRRIDELEAQRRRHERDLRDARTPEHRTEINRRIADVDEQLDYWREHVKKAQEKGVKVWGPEDFAKGDFAQYRRGTWYEVVRVNKKSLTIPALIAGATRRVLTVEQCGLSWTDRLSYSDITGKATRDEIEQILSESSQT
ncbi:DUF3560 domain-containing protein [Actinomadura yumaensis]|uniref:DUF3560 domain-containing protein n=1 Tax=Actinomadura yumaensis TaxID=111807 RepID=A0ABW2CSD1_9ACTN